MFEMSENIDSDALLPCSIVILSLDNSNLYEMDEKDIKQLNFLGMY